MTEETLNDITKFIKEHIILNDDSYKKCFDSYVILLFDTVMTLHNLLCEEVTGDRYDYMFHWCNKLGLYCDDDIFNKTPCEDYLNNFCKDKSEDCKCKGVRCMCDYYYERE